MNTKRVISFTTIALMLCNFVATMPMTAFAAETSNYTYINDNYTIAYNVVDAWDNFENININVYNPTDEPIYHWAFQFDAGGTISNLWNGVIADSNENQYVIENVDYNNVIQPHSSAQLGYIVQFEDEATAPTTFIDCSEAVALTGRLYIGCRRDGSLAGRSERHTDADQYL